MATIEDRFWAKVRKGPLCWEWTGHNTGHKKPYGIFHDSGPERAHRTSWRITYGTIPAGIQVLHACDNTMCVRPDHLFLGTHKDNMADMTRKGLHPETMKTHCPNGHAYAGANLYVRPGKGKRECRTCRTHKASRRDRASENHARAALARAEGGGA